MHIDQSGVPGVQPEDVKRAIDAREDFVLLDVRSSGEYARGRITGSINCSVERVAHDVADLIPDKHAKVYVYCLCANRSEIATAIMRKLGYTDVWNMEYGLLGWRAKYFSVESWPRAVD